MKLRSGIRAARLIGSMLLCLAMILSFASTGLRPVQVSAVNTQCASYSGSNINAYEYLYGNVSTPMDSYLTVTSDGKLLRFQSNAIEGKYLVEYYDTAYNILSTVTVNAELPIFGGFYAHGSHYYILSGQENPRESAAVECFRITQYDLNWNRIDSAGLYDCNTTIPFDAGNARFAVCGKYLLIRTAHEMYMTDDGKNHQANVTIELNTETMVITDSYTQIMNRYYGYVSHSFNQFIQIENNNIVAVDHGDALPRSIVLTQYHTDASDGSFAPYYFNRCTITDLLTFPGSNGDNYTGAGLGGFEISDTSYLVAYNSVAHDENYYSNETKNIFVASMDKETGAVTNKQITFFKEGEAGASIPHFVKISDDSYILLWSSCGDVYYTKVDGEGDVTGKVYTIRDAFLSDCVPVICGNKLVWYTWNNNINIFYDIDLGDISVNSKTVIENGHNNSDIIYPTEPGGDCTITCSVCGYTETFETASDMAVYWNTEEQYGSYYANIRRTKFDVGEKLYLLLDFYPEDLAHNEWELSISDPNGMYYTRYDADWGYFTFKETGTYTISISYKYNPQLSASVTVDVSHTDADNNGICDGCGAVVPVKFSIAGANMVLGSVLDMNFFIDKDDLSGTDYYAVITHYDKDGTKTITVPYGDWQNRTDYMVVTLDGLAARQMADKVEVVIYNGDGSAASNMWTDSVRDYAMRILEKQNAETKTLLVDMLNYGAAAQTYFKYNTADLANNQLSTAQKGYATASVSCVDQRVKGTNYYGSTLTLKNRILLTLYFKDIDPSMYAIVTFTDHKGVKHENRINGSAFTQYNASVYGVVVDDLVVADGDQLVTVKVYSASGTQVAYASDTINSYAQRMMASDALFETVAKFTTAAYAYFH